MLVRKKLRNSNCYVMLADEIITWTLVKSKHIRLASSFWGWRSLAEIDFHGSGHWVN